MTHWFDQLDYTLWANNRTLASLEALNAPPPQAVKLLSHVVAAQYIWLARVSGKPELAMPVWGELSLAKIREVIPAAYHDWKAFLQSRTEANLGDTFTYKNTQGLEFTNTLLEILTHFPIHSAYHRAQIALLVREAGGTPAVTDYIQFAREEHRRPAHTA